MANLRHDLSPLRCAGQAYDVGRISDFYSLLESTVSFNVHACVATDTVFKIIDNFFHDSGVYKLYLYRVVNFSPSSDYEFSIEDYFKFDLFIFEGPVFDDRVINFFDQVAFARKTALLLIEVSNSKVLGRIRSTEYQTKNLIAEEVNSAEKTSIEYAFSKILTRLSNVRQSKSDFHEELTMNPKAFVSYSWDSEEHKGWVADIAARLRSDGVETILDQWHVVPGDQLPEFMEREIRNNDYALVMCTPKYKAKSDARLGGVGYEGDIMTAEVFAKGNHKKFIPILVAGKWVDSAPSWLAGKYYIDLSSPESFEQGYRDLITTIHGHRPKAPPIGKKPTFLTKEEVTEQSNMPAYEIINIEGIVVDEVTTPRLDGTSGSALYKVPFKLSRKPSSLWAHHFVEAWNRPSRFTTMHRPGIASVSGDKIYLNGTTIEEVEKYHRDTLILSVEVANREENAAMIRKFELENAELIKRKAHEESVRIAASKIKF